MANVAIDPLVVNDWHYVGTAFTLRIFSDKSWVALDLSDVPARGDNDNFYREYTVSAVGTVATIPAVTLASQTDAPNERNAKYSAYFYVDGVQQDMLLANTLGAFTVPDTPATTTWKALEQYNYRTNRRYWQDENTYSRVEINRLIAASSAASFVDATTTQKGVGVISVTPVSPTLPKFVGDNDPRMFQLDGGTGLITTKAKVTIGDTAAASSGRINLTFHPTNTATTGRLANWYTQTFAFTNGPGGEPNYDNDTFAFSYNQSASGAKAVAGVVDFGFNNEARFYQGAFQSEHYFDWRSPNGLIAIRPFGWTVQHTSGNVLFNMNGDIAFARDLSQGSGQTAQWEEIGFLEFIGVASTTKIKLPNNTTIEGFNLANNATTPLIKRDTSDKVSIDPGGVGAVFGAGALANTFAASEFIHSGTPTTLLSFDFADQMVLQVAGNILAAVNPTYFELRAPLTWDSDGSGDIGKRSAVNFRPNNVYVKTNVEVGGVFKVGANQVVGARVTGWTAPSGTISRGTFDTATVTTEELAKRVYGIIADLITHGLIGA